MIAITAQAVIDCKRCGKWARAVVDIDMTMPITSLAYLEDTYTNKFNDLAWDIPSGLCPECAKHPVVAPVIPFTGDDFE